MLKTDYSRADSKDFTPQLNRDHKEINEKLQTATTGGIVVGCGRVVAGTDYTDGRAIPADPTDLYIYVPNRLYIIGGRVVNVDEPGGYAIIAAPANMGDARYGYLTETDGGSVTVLPENWVLEPIDENEGILPIVGKVSSDATGVTGIDHTLTDEILTNSQMVNLIKQLVAQINALSTGGGGGGGGGGGIGRGDLIPWDGTDVNTSIKVKTLALIDALRAELKSYVDSGRSKVMQTDNDHFVEALMRLHGEQVRMSTDSADVIEAAFVIVGFAGHSSSGAYADPGINGTTNCLRFTTMNLDTANRVLRP